MQRNMVHDVAMAADEPHTTSKATLGAICFAVEQMAMAIPEEATVIACFQRAAYFAPRARRFARLAALCRTVVVAFEGSFVATPQLHHARLSPASSLIDEWSLVVVAPGLCASVVAIDRHELLPFEATLDGARSFETRWSMERHVAVDELERLNSVLGHDLPANVTASLADAAGAARMHPPDSAERGLAEVFAVFIERLERAHRERSALGVRLSESQQDAEHDSLTGLGNRRFLERWLCVPTADIEIPPIGLVMIDLDGFKQINDTFGHDIGDAVLVAVAATFREQLRPLDIAVRLGGDEFLICCPNVAERELRRIADRLVATIGDIRVGGARAAASAGTAVTRRLPAPLAELDAAMYIAKRRGGGVSAISA